MRGNSCASLGLPDLWFALENIVVCSASVFCLHFGQVRWGHPLELFLTPPDATLPTEDILKHFKMMHLHAPMSDTGQIEELDWTSKEPLSELAFLEAQERGKVPVTFPRISKPPEDPTAPPEPTGGPARPAS